MSYADSPSYQNSPPPVTNGKRSHSGSEDELYTREQDHSEASRLLDKETFEENEEKRKYPWSVLFIIGNEFCERFSFYGMKAVLTLYFVYVIGWSDKTSTVVYHAFVMLCYFTPVIGAVISDSLLGKFRTIAYISLIYVAGSVILSVAAVKPLALPHMEISLLGLVLIGLGTGGIKPCVSAFGGDQFSSSQEKQRQRFFSLFYFAINTGSLLSIAITPFLREDVHCFGDLHCFPLAFGVPAVLMIVSLLLFLLGRPLYKIVPPGGTILVDVMRCIFLGIRGKFSGSRTTPHWLDHADVRFERNFIEDVKAVTRVLFLYIPLPIFWALFDQQGSRWTLQANRMDGTVVEGWVVKPDQIQVINPIFILILIPIFDMFVYPMFARCNLLVKPLHRIVVGGFLAAVAFVVAGFVQIALENTLPVAPQPGTTQFNLINLSPCNLTVQMSGKNATFEILPLKNRTTHIFSAEVNHTSTITFACPGETGLSSVSNVQKTLESGDGKSLLVPFILLPDGTVEVLSEPEARVKAEKGKSNLMMMYYMPLNGYRASNVSLLVSGRNDRKDYSFLYKNDSAFGLTEYQLIEPDTYDIYLPDDSNPGSHLGQIDGNVIRTHQGAVYSLLIYNSSDSLQMESFESVAPNSLPMLWQIPQYFIITLGEIMFSITGLEFSYSQAPASMKSVLQAAWLLTVAVGNAVVIVVSELQIFDKQSYEFFLFACLMGLDMLLFMLMARSYVYVQQPSSDEELVHKKDSIASNGISNQAYAEDTKM